MKPQTLRTLAVLRNRGEEGMTALDALEWVGTQRLAARIDELRKEGHRIERDMIRTRNGAHVARYRLVEDAPVVPENEMRALWGDR
ncbi:MAG TPA: helix-turn-helix domain-containing protein [Thermoleophilia bacterium]|nr:helix-turn-helix domain-containing protein [Thermoleophilia bacterium]